MCRTGKLAIFWGFLRAFFAPTDGIQPKSWVTLDVLRGLDGRFVGVILVDSFLVIFMST